MTEFRGITEAADSMFAWRNVSAQIPKVPNAEQKLTVFFVST